MQLTLPQWFGYPPERRAIINRQRYVLILSPGQETQLVPVTIITEKEKV